MRLLHHRDDDQETDSWTIDRTDKRTAEAVRHIVRLKPPHRTTEAVRHIA
jgi:hypothetical protein